MSLKTQPIRYHVDVLKRDANGQLFRAGQCTLVHGRQYVDPAGRVRVASSRHAARKVARSVYPTPEFSLGRVNVQYTTALQENFA
ncbi:hypothetical protein ACERK3_09500 [Phycisphaerales bacterium AB-hyl4]|uniref:Uncharacterized protein n=1 Tax=Natronomicrosphaera hydrolytica TaxID=3242702 RepID=A0ABV4U4K0_9BACT